VACTAAAGEAASAAEQGRQRSRGGSEEEEGGEKVRGLMWKIKKIQGLPCKIKFPVDLKL
jgi:hypothetical protein